MDPSCSRMPTRAILSAPTSAGADAALRNCAFPAPRSPHGPAVGAGADAEHQGCYPAVMVALAIPISSSALSAGRAAVWVVGLIYAVAWFVQVIKDGHTLADGVLPGWEAMRAALSPIWRWAEFNGTRLEAILCVGSALTNIVFVVYFVRLARRSRASARSWTWLLLGSAAVNTFWIVDSVPPSELRAGYWLWLASFVLLGFIAHFRRAAQPSGA